MSEPTSIGTDQRSAGTRLRAILTRSRERLGRAATDGRPTSRQPIVR